MKMPEIDKRRVKTLKSGQVSDGPVLYIMARDQRVEDNWALLYAQQTALADGKSLAVIAGPTADYPEASERQIEFSLAGLKQVEKQLSRLHIPVLILTKTPQTALPELVKRLKASSLVFDFSPLRESGRWKKAVIDRVNIPAYEVDAHNIVPVWQASPKLEYAAYTLRPKINRLLPEFLTDFPALKKHPVAWPGDAPANGWGKIEKSLKFKSDGSSLIKLKSGADEAARVLESFLHRRLNAYHQKRNDPNAEAQSDLSPYLHFGQISAQRVALETQRHDDDIKSQEAFIEELIVRRELSDNFCFYNDKYDSFDGFPEWAQKTLDEHRSDPRPYLYDRDTLEAGKTHDELWNAAQLEMVITGKMHGYMRMYWAKKILEWSHSPEEALATAIYLNDKYELDGRDPNGYTGVAWSIGGVHDRPWFEREIFGKVRYMSYGGCKRKFSIADYVDRIAGLKSEVAA